MKRRQRQSGTADHPGARQLRRRWQGHHNAGTFNPKQPTPAGQTLHGDHASDFFQIPANRRKLPLVFLHGTGNVPETRGFPTAAPAFT
jgi:hypothetical protein